MKLPPLKALPVFEAVARLNSFSRAADELAVSQSAVSHQIKQLESYLGEPLFLRAGRSLVLTEEGRTYLEAIGASLLQIERASDQLRGRETSRLRLAAFSSFSVRWLIPRLPELQNRYPQLDLALAMTTESPTLSDRVADCFITINTSTAAFSYELLYREQLFPVCSRRFWQRIVGDLVPEASDPLDGEVVLRPDQLIRYPLLSTYSIYGRDGSDWEHWFQAVGLPIPADARIQHFSHMLMALEAARYDQGIVLTNDYMLGSHEAAEELVRIPAHSLVTGDRFYFAWKTSRRNEPGIQALRRWLVEQAIAAGLRGKQEAEEPHKE